MADSGRSSIGVRVRPNAHDFIRLLRQQLASKQYTFYVDVRARTGKASGDVREWANGPLQKINASVQVNANFAKANTSLAEWRRKVAATNATIGVNADLSPADRDIRIWRNSIDKDITVRVRAQTVGKGVDGINREIARAGRQNVQVGAEVDRSSVRRAAKQVQDDLQQDGLFSIELDPKTKKAKAKISEFFADVQGEQAELDLGIDTTPAIAKVKAVKANIEKDPVKAQLQIDTAKARLELLNLRLQEKRRKITLDLEVKKGKSDAIHGAIDDFNKGFGNVNPIRALDFGPVTLGKPSGLVGTLTTITALAGAVPAAVTGLAGLSKALMDVAGAAAIVPGAIGGLLAVMSTVAVATSGVSDTFSAMFDMWNEGASEQAASANSLVSAHNTYENAVKDEAKAQRDVGRARRDALGDLRDLNNELRGGVLNEAQALLDLQKARDRYAQGGFDNETDRLQAQLDIAKAEEGVITTREGNIKLQQKVNEANEQGVEGSDKVQDALEAQTRASQQTAQAAAALATATSGGGGAAQKFADALGNLSPNAQEFINTISGSKSIIEDFKLGIQDIFFQDLGPGAAGLMDSLLPTLQQGMGGLAQAMNGVILQAFDTLGGPDGQSIIERVFGGTTEAVKEVQKLVDPLVRGVGTLVAAGAEHLPQVVQLFTNLSERFANFIEKADADGSLDSFLDRGVDALGKIAELGINVVDIVNEMSKAFGGDLLQSLVDMTRELADFLGSVEGQNKMAEYAQEAKEVWEEWKPILQDMPGIFNAIQNAAQVVLAAITPFINVFSSFMDKYPGITSAFIGTLLGAKAITGIFGPIVGLFGTFGKVLGGLSGFLATITTNLFKIAGLPPLPGMNYDNPGQPMPGDEKKPKSKLGNIARFAPIAAVAAPALATAAVVDTANDAAEVQKGQPEIDAINAQLPPGSPIIAGFHADKSALEGFKQAANSQDISPEMQKLAKWLLEPHKDQIGTPGAVGGNYILEDPASEIEFAKRYLWVTRNPGVTEIPVSGSYMKGGYTPWPRDVGKTVELHGREYVQPANVVEHYGVEGMEAIRSRSVPPELLRGFAGGGWFDPQDPNATQHGAGGAPGPTPLNASQPNPAGTGVLSALNTGINGITNVAGQQLAGLAPTGAAPGTPAAPTTPGVPGAGITPAATPLSIAGFSLPGLSLPQVGWPGGTPPVGLGGGPDGFDIRKYGIGPGPVGSGPQEWLQKTADIGGNLVSNLATTAYTGLLSFFGLENSILSPSNTYTSAALGLVNNSLGGNAKAQGAGAGQTNADVTSLLNTYGGMPLNPADGGFTAMPNVFGATGSALGGGAGGASGGGSGGLQVNTARGKQIIQQMFPWATNIGGVRPDRLKWHPSGLALDVMIPGANGGLNAPTPPAGKAMGDQLYSWLMANKAQLGIDYIMWQEKDHFNHLHVNFAESGFADGSAAPVQVSAPGATAVPGDTPTSDLPSTPPGSNKWLGGGAAPGAPGASAPTGMPAAQEKYMRDRYNTLTPEQKASPYFKGLYNDDGSPKGPAPAAKPPAANFFGPALTRDQGGIIPPGVSVVKNYTGRNEMVVNPSRMHTLNRTFADGGFNFPQGMVAPRPKPQPPVQAKKIAPPIAQPVAPKPPPAMAAPPPPVATPTAPPAPAPTLAPEAPVSPAGPTGPGGAPQTTAGPRLDGLGSAGGGGGGGGGDHLNPALAKGITSGFAAAGNVAAAAASAFGGGGGGGLISGLFGQAGKIASNIANVGASFLVGNVTGGTTENSYGVTQAGNIPSGGTRVVDASSNHTGDIYTNDLDDYFRRTNRREAQRAQSGLGRWGNA